MEHVRTCAYCGQKFTAPNLKRKYCSDLCKNRQKEIFARERDKKIKVDKAKLFKPKYSMSEIMRMKRQYEAKNGITVTYGRFVQLVERGLITI